MESIRYRHDFAAIAGGGEASGVLVSQRELAFRPVVGSLTFRKRIDVHYQSDPAIAQNRRATQQVLLPVGYAQILD